MRQLNFFFGGRGRPALCAAYGATIAAFLWICGNFYLPNRGFTYLVEFGSKGEARYIPELRSIPHYDQPDSYGYDGQYYAQIAMRPQLGSPDLLRAVDNLPYRARRILFCWTAWALAGGDPGRALAIFSVENLAAWLLLAALLLRWFPPLNWGNWARWAGVLASIGLCVSLRSALMDGPSLLVIAAGMAFLETGRPWLAAAVFGVSGLGRETNLLAGAALVPGGGKRGLSWLRALGQWALVLIPLAAWIAFVTARLGGGGVAGARNFAPPFAGYWGKCLEIARFFSAGPARLAVGMALVQVALTTQLLFLVLRPRWSDPWWRLGAAYAALLAVLGSAVWEGYPGAVSRVVLPMLLAFNILVPRGRRWWIVLLLGNLSFIASPTVLSPPPGESFLCTVPAVLRAEVGTEPVGVAFGAAWYPEERSWLEWWRWTGGDAALVLRNSRPQALGVSVGFGLRSKDRRTVEICDAAGRIVWEGILQPGILRSVAIPSVNLPPGDTPWRFVTDQPPIRQSPQDPRSVAFSLRNLRIDVNGVRP